MQLSKPRSILLHDRGEVYASVPHLKPLERSSFTKSPDGYSSLWSTLHQRGKVVEESIIGSGRGRGDPTRSSLELRSPVPLLISDDLGRRKLGPTAAEELLEIVMRRYGRTSTLVTSNRPIEDWGRFLGDTAAVTAMLDRLLHHGHILKCGPRSWRTRSQTEPSAPEKP